MRIQSLFYILVSLLFCAWTALAAPPNKPVFDGRILEYDTSELRGSFVGTPAWPGAAMSNLYVTWDETNLYIALQCRMDNTKVSILMDIDPGNGTGATTTTNWVNGTNVMFIYNDNGWRKSDGPGAKPFGLDFMIATEGFYNSVVLVLYDGVQVPGLHNGKRMFDLPDVGNGNVPVGTAIEMVVLKDNTANQLKGFETRIPWNVLYGANTNRFGVVDPGHVVPVGATVRLFANIHNNSPTSSFSVLDTIPQQTSTNAEYNSVTGLLTTDDYIDVVIDQNLDGFPDLAPGDVNAPYLVSLIGIAGSTSITGIFNEAVAASSVTIPSNWSIAGTVIQQVDVLAPNRVVITVDEALPAAGTLLYVQTQGIEDLSGNSRIALNTLVTRSSSYLSGYSSMAVAGDFQGWNPDANNMTQIRDYTWLYDVSILSTSGIVFKFAANGAWTINFGRASGTASSLPLVDFAGNPGGQNIPVPASLNGVFRFIFNEQTRQFSMVQVGQDSDGDGLPDEWETYHGLVPTDDGSGLLMNGPAGDNDSDFVSNFGEYVADTDPNDIGSYLAARSVACNAFGGIDVTFPASTNRIYSVDANVDPATTSWTSIIPAFIPGTGSVMTITDTNQTGIRNYRVNVRTP